jgi:hypothetical protein
MVNASDEAFAGVMPLPLALGPGGIALGPRMARLLCRAFPGGRPGHATGALPGETGPHDGFYGANMGFTTPGVPLARCPRSDGSALPPTSPARVVR